MNLASIRLTAIVIAVLAAAQVAEAQVPEYQPKEEEKPYWDKRIVEIEVQGNTKTQRDTVLLIADIDTGDTFRERTSYEVSLRLIGSGLFKEVKVTPEKSMKSGGIKLVILARDKHSWVVGPTFYNQPGNVGGGVGFGEANMFGENKQLLLYAQIATADSLFVAVYQDPAIGGTRFSYQPMIFLRREKVTEYTNPDDFFSQPIAQRITTMHYLNAGFQVGMKLFAGFSVAGRIRGAYVFFDEPHWDDVWLEMPDNVGTPDPEAPQEDGWDVSYEAMLVRDKRANYHGVTTGSYFKVHWEEALPELGSDVDYWKLTTSLHLGLKFFSTHNLYVKSGFSTGETLPFQQELTAGGSDLRGYVNRQFRGDTKLAAQTEYSLKLFSLGPLSFRGLAFWDTAYTGFYREDPDLERHFLPGQTDNSVNKWRNGVGGGFRVYIKSIVLPLLGVDWGYGIEANDAHIYFALGLLEM